MSRKKERPQWHGWINCNKPRGLTSHDVIDVFRRLLKQRKIGHTGTLDPDATGVLPLCLGDATRLAEFVQADQKKYRAAIRFGKQTDTYDASGNVTRDCPANHVELSQIESVLPRFQGTIQQVPPLFSAIKRKGKKLYEYGRQGIDVERPIRTVEIFDLVIIAWQSGTYPLLTIEVACSAGTYIRSLAHDLGEAIGCGAHLETLVRLSSGPFSYADSWTPEAVKRAVLENDVRSSERPSWLLPLDWPLRHWPSARLSPAQVEAVRHGRPLNERLMFTAPVKDGDRVRLLHTTGTLCAIGQVAANDDNGACGARVVLHKVFPSQTIIPEAP